MAMKRLFIAASLVPSLAIAGQAVLKWDPPTDTTGITGYQVLYGKASGSYTEGSLSVIGQTASTATVKSLKAGTKYYFVARSTTPDPAVFSANSNEVSATIPTNAPAGLSVSVSGDN